jgi:hypothetical protein
MPSARKSQPTAAPKKSPVRASIAPRTTGFPGDRDGLTGATGPQKGRGQVSAADLGQMMIGEFATALRTQVNKYKRPYQEGRITAYTDAAKALQTWMKAKRINDDFTACDTTMLNLFFADYLAGHTQGHWHAPAEPCTPVRLAGIDQITGAGRARRFQDIRDHAIIRVLTEGPRITEVAQM